MSRKPLPQPKEDTKSKPEIVEQQADPFLKTLQKKVRNINKKLTDIAELELKANIKPDQVEKINRKATLIEEKSKLEETAALFRQAYLENAVFYRNAQLKELQTFARAIVILHSSAKHPYSQKLTSLWESLQKTGENHSLNDAISSLANGLKEFAEDKKVQKAMSTYVEENGRNVIVAQRKVSQVEQIKAAEVPAVSAPIVLTKTALQSTPVQENVIAAEHTKNSEPNSTLHQYLDTEKRKPQHKGKVHNRAPLEEREKEDRKKKLYKPKYVEKEAEPKDKLNNQDDSSSFAEPEARNFRREEVREPEDDGFIVLQKPKLKYNARDERPAFERPPGQKPHPRKEYIKT